MTISTLHYDPPIRRSTRQRELDYELLEQAESHAAQGEPLQGLAKVFQHLFPGQTLPELSREPFTFTQGSSRVTTQVNDTQLLISVPLVRLPDGGKAIAALRYVLTRIAASGQLYQPRLRDSEIHLEHRDRLSRFHPAKVLEVLRQMPAQADATDDWLIGQFGAQPLDRAGIEPLSDEEAASAQRIWTTHWNDVEELLRETQRKRSMFFLNETTAYAIHRLHFVLPISGFLGARLAESAGGFNNSDEDPVRREAALGKCIKEMKAVSPEELRKNLGHATYSISRLANGSGKVLQGYLGECDYMETVTNLKSSGHFLDAALALVCTYSYLLSRFAWPEQIEAAMRAGLQESCGKPWRELASGLHGHAAELVEEFGCDDEDEEEEDAGGDDSEDGENS